MTGRQRLLTSLQHRQPDRVPVDFGGTLCSGMHVSCIHQLRRHYGLDAGPVKVHEPFQMLGQIDDDLKDIIGVDVEGVNPRNTLFGFPNADWKEWRMDDGTLVLVPKGFVIRDDDKGDHYIFPEGDATVPPSGRMPKNGFYFDAIIRQEEIDEDTLNPKDNLEEFQLLSEDSLSYFSEAIHRAAATGRGVLVNPGGTGLGDVALVPGPFMKHPKGIRDITEWYVSTAIRQDYLHQVFNRQTDIAIANFEQLHRAVGNSIDVLFVCGTDFGTQTGTFCSKDTFSDLYLPYYRKMNSWIHRNTSWKTFKHCCGAVEAFMPLFIEAGFDIINPVQCSAAGMDAALLKQRYGNNLTFWGGGVDTQQVLPFGTPAQVRGMVLDRCRIFADQGGFVFNAIHNVQANTPVENIAAMIDAVREFNGLDKVSS